MITPYPEYEHDVSFCKNIHRKYGKSFYFGTLLLSRSEHDATCILYAFFRWPDEYVDTLFANQKEEALQKLSRWSKLWEKSYRGLPFSADESETRILRAATYIFKAYSIPFEYSQAFLSAMVQDTWKERYETYTDLEAYMYGSASVVGLMMTYVICADDFKFKNDKEHRELVLQRARALGEAFQLTNFLRDIGEDISVRGRIYIPHEDMKAYLISEDDILSKKISMEFVALMKFEISRARVLYRLADEGISMLPPKAAKGIRMARVLYSNILDEIEGRNYNIYATRIHLSLFRKLWIALPLLLKKYQKA